MHKNPLDRRGLTPLPYRAIDMSKPFIENVSYHGMTKASHYDPGEYGVWISITDPCTMPAPAAFPFLKMYGFQFLDIEENDPKFEEFKEFVISKEDGERIADILRKSFADGSSVIVSCMAGLCRSGAVAQAGIDYGFVDVGSVRAPNLMVYKAVAKPLLGVLPNDYST